MLSAQIVVNIFLFIIGSLGILLNGGNLLLILMCVEMMLLSVDLNFAIFSIYLTDAMGQLFFLFCLTVAAAESAIGLAILIVYFKLRRKISLVSVNSLRS